MSDLAQIYTADWFRRRERYRPVYGAFARAIEEVFHPTSLLDVGCGAGYILEHFVGRIPVFGFDGSEGAEAAQSAQVRIHTACWDLTSDAVLPVPEVDLAVSVEVAEHLAEQFLPSYLRYICVSRRVLFTAAPPGQRGNHHVNCQPPIYWIGALAAVGFRHDGAQTEKWKARARALTSGCPWVVRNALYFERYP